MNKKCKTDFATISNQNLTDHTDRKTSNELLPTHPSEEREQPEIRKEARRLIKRSMPKYGENFTKNASKVQYADIQLQCLLSLLSTGLEQFSPAGEGGLPLPIAFHHEQLGPAQKE